MAGTHNLSATRLPYSKYSKLASVVMGIYNLSAVRSPQGKFDLCSGMASIDISDGEDAQHKRSPHSECSKFASLVVGTHNKKSKHNELTHAANYGHCYQLGILCMKMRM